MAKMEWDTKRGIARRETIAAFANFDKWETYGTAFTHMDNGHITLREIKEIANFVAAISPGVIEMRRSDWLHMA